MGSNWKYLPSDVKSPFNFYGENISSSFELWSVRFKWKQLIVKEFHGNYDLSNKKLASAYLWEFEEWSIGVEPITAFFRPIK